MNDEAADDFQRPATEWKYVNDTIGTFTDKADAVYTKKVTAANIYSVVGKSTADDLEDGHLRSVQLHRRRGRPGHCQYRATSLTRTTPPRSTAPATVC